MVQPSSTMVAALAEPCDQLPRDVRWINLRDLLRHFFRVKHEELMCLSVRFFGRCFFFAIYGTREVEKNANCVEVRDIKSK